MYTAPPDASASIHPLPLAGRRLVLGVSGGIAAYKSAHLLRLLRQAGAEVDVVLTEAGAHFVGAATFQALSGRAVWQSLWDARAEGGMAHIALSRQADAILIAPASADMLARLAHGQADDLLATLCLARTCPLIVAPAMNRQMWEHPATVRNVATLRGDGVHFFGPAEGEQACGEHGPGRMEEAETLFARTLAFFQPKVLAGRKVVLTAGATFEAIDPVRGITNSSSGRMGYALAAACAEAGAEVVLVSGPTALPCPLGVTRVDVLGAREMLAAVEAHLAGADIFIAVAAVADYRAAHPSAQKIKKDDGAARTLELVENPDILATIAARPNAPLCVGFAAESERLDEHAEAKRRRKKVPLIIGNLVNEGMGGDFNTVSLYSETGIERLPRMEKTALARQLVARFAALLSSHPTQGTP